MSHGKPFTLYNSQLGPNGWKVVFLLQELGLEYENVFLDLAKKEQKSPEHLKYNPNGRIPTLIDHKNGDFAIWESNAIITYIADTYDKEGKFHFLTGPEKYEQTQWLYFQASGQGPYYGQLVGSFRVPAAAERYRNEAKRVISVLDSVLSKSGSDWLVGNKYSIADMSFIIWNVLATTLLLENYDMAKEAPYADAWMKRMMARPAIKRAFSEKEAVTKAKEEKDAREKVAA
ncbi:hypothetical protein JAAARDRAFT_118470 [Jaapia argillacea MUCL 33604]|uniref:glutathione transferase n=1 Tax=Jaapia argillacea MUCL 33604 TaxID=933084 RepID=A0A067QD42_9AGAM|nr:hypothetical protein JAAARDRAFT_118470 [Jaapia argillacea MUCL 33604]